MKGARLTGCEDRLMDKGRWMIFFRSVIRCGERPRNVFSLSERERCLGDDHKKSCSVIAFRLSILYAEKREESSEGM